jgi:hypothetical protein
MSYSIYIGEAYIDVPPTSELRHQEYNLRVRVKRTQSPDAPCFTGDNMTGITNGRHPSYGGWADFCQSTGLEDLFYHQDHGLFKLHPGAAYLTEEVEEIVYQTLLKYQKNHPGAKPGWGEGEDPHLARLEWLQWWMRWALNTCAIPAIENS